MRLDEYADALTVEGKAARTVTEYTKWVRRLLHHCHHQHLNPATLTHADIHAWAQTLPRSWASRKQAHAAVAHYMRLIGRRDMLEAAIPVPRKPRPKYRGLRPQDAHQLRDAAVLVGGRAGTATLIGLYTAARRCEIAELRWDGITRDRVKWWRSKTQEWHDVPLHPVLRDALDTFRPPLPEGYVFPGDGGRPYVAPVTVWQWIRDVGQTAGVDVTPHQLRATAINRVLEVTRDLDAAAAFGGHRDVQVTRDHYTTTSEVRLQSAVDALDY